MSARKETQSINIYYIYPTCPAAGKHAPKRAVERTPSPPLDLVIHNLGKNLWTHKTTLISHPTSRAKRVKIYRLTNTYIYPYAPRHTPGCDICHIKLVHQYQQHHPPPKQNHHPHHHHPTATPQHKKRYPHPGSVVTASSCLSVSRLPFTCVYMWLRVRQLQ